jgi:hypothetical protein
MSSGGGGFNDTFHHAFAGSTHTSYLQAHLLDEKGQVQCQSPPDPVSLRAQSEAQSANLRNTLVTMRQDMEAMQAAASANATTAMPAHAADAVTNVDQGPTPLPPQQQGTQTLASLLELVPEEEVPGPTTWHGALGDAQIEKTGDAGHWLLPPHSSLPPSALGEEVDVVQDDDTAAGGDPLAEEFKVCAIGSC